MIKDNRGQVSLEYMLIFTISLIILIVFTMPLLNQNVKTTMDVSDSIKVKSDLSKIAFAIKTVYGEGQGSKQTVNIYADKATKVNIASNLVSCNIKLKDNTNKHITVPSKSNLKSSSITLEKGENSIVVEWPVGSDKMVVSV